MAYGNDNLAVDLMRGAVAGAAGVSLADTKRTTDPPPTERYSVLGRVGCVMFVRLAALTT